ncbi:MAG: MarR family transcriptional regulator [Clostridiales Family XIII bacterium]|nr:MarR family transcriptional regulator [Clostridiales Family XIII bacterium]
MYYDKAADHFINGIGNMHAKSPMGHVERFSKGEMFLLNMLERHGASMSAGEIGGQMHVSSARIAAVLGRLEDKGYIERSIDTADRRRINVVLTEFGRRRVEAHKEAMRRRLSITFKKMGRQDTEEFGRLMGKFMAIMSEIDEAADGDL